MTEIDRLIAIMSRLRNPDGGCPWDLAQDFASIVPHTLEEAYEVADAIAGGDRQQIRDELGDLLFQVVFYAQLGKEEGAFDFDAVAKAISDKLVRRHPHVFGELNEADGERLKANWEAIKAEERQDKGLGDSVLSDVPLALPALSRSVKLQKRAARVGFEWDELAPVFAKIQEEIAEVQVEVAAQDQAKLEEEMGDLLFAVSNLARHLKVDPEAALRLANQKFERRFRAIEQRVAAAGEDLASQGLDKLEAHWQAVKADE
ncbi:nucleoside triphosphate pyrophosphohydrolase [Gallaecimonas xiamenensis]|uniref:Nucleoside triphosphate pyrophosphohydrolase n=1 Tax=Gallaecimonas xiamenensis 3-C-1 TaxID=745411 RepID=K2JA47_9GAMM|nr:nucleoside triphosphate pyrophosphohydrolase [Gallaecimonas xiamenensis]EKE71657.1 nucleoside triphosphate pyrophosphohydrolase [Gallaecimonas xiamenensis 3-C-1]